jgi:hypothetical protein
MPIWATYPLESAREALEAVRGRGVQGRVVLTTAPETA